MFMANLQFNIHINAPKQKVWETMLGDKTYREWTSVFQPGSHYEGSWEKGDSIRFVALGEDGKLGGMTSKIAENKPYEFISIEHLGVVTDGKDDFEGPYAYEFAGAHENYTFTEDGDGTSLTVDLEGQNLSKEMADMFTEMWPTALEKLKQIAER
jgi:uncharacterized protein YndB with AHSA1/START domain